MSESLKPNTVINVLMANNTWLPRVVRYVEEHPFDPRRGSFSCFGFERHYGDDDLLLADEGVTWRRMRTWQQERDEAIAWLRRGGWEWIAGALEQGEHERKDGT